MQKGISQLPILINLIIVWNAHYFKLDICFFYSKFNSLSQSEKEPYKKKEEEQLTRVIKQLDVIEKYLIPDYFYKCSNGKELYHQWCLKRAKKNKEDLTDASLLSELNYLSMEEEEINK